MENNKRFLHSPFTPVDRVEATVKRSFGSRRATEANEKRQQLINGQLAEHQPSQMTFVFNRYMLGYKQPINMMVE